MVLLVSRLLCGCLFVSLRFLGEGHTDSSAAITIMAPHSAFAAPSLASLGIVCDISQAARPGCRAKKGLPILARLRVRARNALRAAGKFSHTREQKRVVKTEEGEDDLTHLEGSVKLRRVGSDQRGSISPPVQPPSLPPIGTPMYDQRRLPPVSNERSPTETISTSATLLDPISGVVPPFPSQGQGQGYGYNNMPMEGQYNVSPSNPDQWLSDFSPQWSDQSLLYNNSNGLISPTSNGLATSATYATEFSFFPDLNTNSNVNGQGQGQGSGQMYNAAGHMMNPHSIDGPSLLDLGMDKDMFMALGIEGGIGMGIAVDGGNAGSSGQNGNGGGNWNGNTNGSGSGNGAWGGNEQSGEQWSELDFDQWVDGMGGAY